MFSLWRKARRENSAASRLLGSTSLRFALHGWQRLKDLPLWFDEQPALVRGLRDLYYRLLGRQIYVFVSHPVLKMPEALKKEMFLVEMALPSEEDILTQLHKHGGQGTVSDEDMLYHMAVAMTSVSSAS
ncbi:hypothetical protein [Thiolapillus sp.]|uniref:hypothetical protein n=1 Tax=Thiolapillus sp. TaxID=2017437 RepID=UPI003AF883B4